MGGAKGSPNWGRGRLQSPLLNVQAPITCGACKSMVFAAHSTLIDGKPRIVALESKCGLMYPVDENGFMDSGKLSRLKMSGT